MTVEFTPFPKIARWKRPITITEKLDGTNAAVRILPLADVEDTSKCTAVLEGWTLTAQSRNRIITPGKDTDNMAFALWVWDNAPTLLGLGEGIHYGEWWGRGIQRTYGLTERRFSLFNAGRWTSENPPPSCCSVVPVLYQGPAVSDSGVDMVSDLMDRLGMEGSQAAPGFMNPEGIIIYHSASGALFKRTFEHDETGKERA